MLVSALPKRILVPQTSLEFPKKPKRLQARSVRNAFLLLKSFPLFYFQLPVLKEFKTRRWKFSIVLTDWHPPFSLISRWNNHPVNLVSSFSGLFSNERLTDVTLAAEGRHLKAHKMLLSACSDYFQVFWRAKVKKSSQLTSSMYSRPAQFFGGKLGQTPRGTLSQKAIAIPFWAPSRHILPRVQSSEIGHFKAYWTIMTNFGALNTW